LRKKKRLGYIWGDFFTNFSGHPGRDAPKQPFHRYSFSGSRQRRRKKRGKCRSQSGTVDKWSCTAYLDHHFSRDALGWLGSEPGIFWNSVYFLVALSPSRSGGFPQNVRIIFPMFDETGKQAKLGSVQTCAQGCQIFLGTI
jgi:hypothetical protein